MTWFWWLNIALLVMAIVGRIAYIGEKREPITRGDAAFAAIVNGLLIWGFAYYGLLR